MEGFWLRFSFLHVIWLDQNRAEGNSLLRSCRGTVSGRVFKNRYVWWKDFEILIPSLHTLIRAFVNRLRHSSVLEFDRFFESCCYSVYYSIQSAEFSRFHMCSKVICHVVVMFCLDGFFFIRAFISHHAWEAYAHYGKHPRLRTLRTATRSEAIHETFPSSRQTRILDTKILARHKFPNNPIELTFVLNLL